MDHDPPNDSRPADTRGVSMTFADLFCGIGGFRLGLEQAGMRCAWACEIDGLCRKVYLKHWPETEPFYDDIRTITDPPRVDLVCGGFPCQPFSVAGKRKGAADDRNLWPEMLRIVGLVRPVWVVGENVPGIGDYLDTVVSDLEAIGYEVLPLEIPAAALGANHLRNRVWIVAHAKGDAQRPGLRESEPRWFRGGRSGNSGLSEDVADATSEQVEREGSGGFQPVATQCGNIPDSPIPRLEGTESERAISRGGKGLSAECYSEWWATEPDVGRVAHGVPNRVDRLKSLGNAVVPQVVEWIGRRIMEVEQCKES